MTVVINGTTGYSGPVGTIGDLTTTGNTTLGDASGDTLTINGGTTTLTQGTANGVAYLNGSKALTTGSALVFDGTNLGVGTSSPGERLTVQTALTGTTAGSNTVGRFQSNGSGYDANIALGDNVNASARVGYLSGNMYFWTNGSERMRLDSAGNLGLGVTPSAWNTFKALQVNYGGLASTSGNNTVVASNAIYDGAWKYLASDYATSYNQNAGTHFWRIAPSGTAGNAISFTQALSVGHGTSLALQGATSQSGTGITFPATQNASSNANTLDDYEEGTFTAGLSFGGGSTGIIYGNNTFSYQKVGNTVHISGYMSLVNKGSSTGSAKITGMPFTAASGNGTYSCTAFHLDSISFSGYPHAFIAPNATGIDIMNAYDAGGSSSFLTNTNFSNSSGLIVNLTYRCA